MSDKNKKKNKQNKNPGPGALLKQARNNKKLSIEDVSSRLRLSKSVIEALEEDHYEKLPAAIFVRGYLKSYAAFVGVDAQQLIARYDQQAGETNADISLGTAHVTPPSMAAIRKRKKRMLPLIVGGVLLVLGMIVWMFLDTDTEMTIPVQQARQTDELEPAINDSQAPSEVVSTQGSESVSQPEPDESVLTAPPMVAVTEPVSETTSAPEQEQASDVAHEQQPAQPEMDQLKFIFNGDSWVDLSDATGKRLIYGMLKSGQQRTVTGTPPFKMTLGNAPEINLTRNGETVDLTPYTRGKVAKFRLGQINE